MCGKRSKGWLPAICSHYLLHADLQLGQRSGIMYVSSPYHIRFANYKNFNEAQVNVHSCSYMCIGHFWRSIILHLSMVCSNPSSWGWVGGGGGLSRLWCCDLPPVGLLWVIPCPTFPPPIPLSFHRYSYFLSGVTYVNSRKPNGHC